MDTRTSDSPQMYGVPPNEKGFFSVERTYLQWMHVALYLGVAGLVLPNAEITLRVHKERAPVSLLLVVTFLPAALLSVIYFGWQWNRRMRAYQRGSVRDLQVFRSTHYPFILCIFLSLSALVAVGATLDSTH